MTKPGRIGFTPILEVGNATPMPVVQTTKEERIGFAALFLDNRYHLEPATDGRVEVWDTQTETVIKTAANMARAQMFVASMERGT